MAITPDDILQFWRAAGSEKWWKKDADFDHQIADQFGDTYQTAANKKLEHWCDDPDGSLALIIVLDQFSRIGKQLGQRADHVAIGLIGKR